MDVVAGVLLDSEARILLGKRPQDKQLGGLWEFPGGKVEACEDHLSALKRELAEELGIVVDKISQACLSRSVHTHNDQQICLFAYRVMAWQGKLALHAHSELKWCTWTEAQALPKPSGDALILMRLGA